MKLLVILFLIFTIGKETFSICVKKEPVQFSDFLFRNILN